MNAKQRKAAAAIYRKAAEKLDLKFRAGQTDTGDKYACVAIEQTAPERGHALSHRFFDTFVPSPAHVSCTIFSRENEVTPDSAPQSILPLEVSQPRRVLALLIFAAAVEAGAFDHLFNE